MSQVTDETSIDPVLVKDLTLPEQPVLPETPEEKFKREKKESQLKKYNDYYVKFESRIKDWKETHWRHPQIRDNPPIVWDSKIQDYVWMNRSWRRG